MSRNDGMPVQGTERGRAYKAFRDHVKRQCLRSATRLVDFDSDQQLAELAEQNQSLLELKDLRPGTVHHDVVLTNLSVMYANDDLMGERVIPTIFTNGSLSGTYFEKNKRDRFAYPDDSMAERSDPNEVTQGRSKKTYAEESRALKGYLPWEVIQNQSAPLNELVDVQDLVLGGIAHRKELRIISLVETTGNYAGNTVALAAGDRFDSAGGGDPGGVVDDAVKAIWTGGGPGQLVMITSLDVHNVLKRHPAILDTFKYGVGAEGPKMATRQMIAEYFEVDEYIVGKARSDTANEGQTASYSRMWDDGISILRVATSPSVNNLAWGYSFQDLPTRTDLFWQPEQGAFGRYMARSAHHDVQQVIAGDAGYRITTPIG